MDFLKELFGAESLNWETFSSKVTEKGFKLADLSSGNYVAKKKFDDELGAKDKSITNLQEQIKTRDKDITDLKQKLEGEGDNAVKIEELTNSLTKLQSDYDNAKKDYQSQLSKQSYEFAVKEFASNQKFTSTAARRDFERQMISENLKIKDGTIIGADDFMKLYQEKNTDAFVVDTPKPYDNSGTGSDNQSGLPQFVAPPTQQGGGEENPFISAFNFQPIH